MLSPDDLLGFLKNRRTVRQYKEGEISRTQLEQLLEAARWAPSPHNAQPCRFVVVVDPDLKDRLATAMGQAWAEDLSADGMSEEFIRLNVEGSRQRINSAAAVVVVCITEQDLDQYPDARRQSCERAMAMHAVGAAVQNISLMAHAMGLGSCWMCAPLFCPEAVRDTLELPEDWEPQALLTLGWPQEHPAPPRRKSLETLVLWHGLSE